MFKNKQGRFRSGWVIAAALAVFLVIAVIVQMIFLIVLFFLSINKITGLYDIIDTINKIVYDWFGVLLVVQALIMIAVAVFAWKKIYKRPLWQMGFTSLKEHGGELGFGLLLGALSICVIFAVLLATGEAKVLSWRPVLTPDVFFYLLLFILVGISEELFFRGFCMSVMRRTKSMAQIIIFSSLLFGLAHISNPGFTFLAFINISLIGMVFAIMYIKSGSIWMPIGFHITWNYFQGLVFGMSVSGIEARGFFEVEFKETEFLVGGSFGPEGSLLASAVMLLGLAAVMLYYRNKEKLDFFSLDPLPQEAALTGNQVISEGETHE